MTYQEFSEYSPPIEKGITGIFTIKDAIEGGYFFVEAILAALPFCSKIFLNDGGSKDGTFEYLKKLRELYPSKIRLFKIPDPQVTLQWKIVDYAINVLIPLVETEWIFELQGDELIHEKDIPRLLDIINDAKEFNGIRMSRWDLNWSSFRPNYDMRTVRFVRKNPTLRVKFGGDHFTINELIDPRQGCTLHNVPPELDIFECPVYHYPDAFIGNRFIKAKRHATELSSDSKSRVDIFKSILERIVPRQNWFPSFELNHNAPAFVRGLQMMYEYRVREELFDKEFVSKLTGLDYARI